MLGLVVNHSPEAENRSHTDVILAEHDEDLTEARIKLGRIAKIAIPLSN